MTTDGPGLPPYGVHHLVAGRVRATPDTVAVRHHQGAALTYGELWERAGSLAATLSRSGIGRGDAVVLAMDRSVELVVALLGVARSGAAYVLLDPHSPTSRNALILEEVGARAVVLAADQPEAAIPAGPRRIVLPLTEPPDVAPPEVDGAAEDPLYVSYTSGSTGRPKGVVTPHRAVVNFVTSADICTLSGSDVVASLSSPASDATTMEIWSTLAAGATIVVLPHIMDLGVEDWPGILVRHGITVMFLMTALFDLIARANPAAFAPLRTLMFAGEPVNPDTVLRVCAADPPRRLVQGYGPTETTVFATYFECTAESVTGRAQVPLGTAMKNYDLYVLDADFAEVRPGESGELFIGGPGVATGYFGRPDLTAQRFLRRGPSGAPIYRTGDLVRQQPDGNLEFLGRVDRQVKIRGYRVELEEVERAVLATGLATAAVVEKVGEGRLGHLVCFLVPQPDPDASTAGVASGGADLAITLSAATAKLVPGYMIPARWIGLPALPVTSTGKVDRNRLLAEHA